MVEVRALPWLAFFLIVDVLLGMAQTSIAYAQQEMPELENKGETFYAGAGSIISDYNKNNNLSNTSTIPGLPVTTQGESGSLTILFSDTWNAFKNFFTDIGTGISVGLKIFSGMLYGMYNVLLSMGVPYVYALSLGTLWHLLTLMAFIVFFRGY